MTNTDRLAQALRKCLIEMNACNHQAMGRNGTEGESVTLARAAAVEALAEHDALASLAHAAVEGEPVASSACPICRKDSPHAHTWQAIELWLNQLVAAWGYRAYIAYEGRLPQIQRYVLGRHAADRPSEACMELSAVGHWVAFDDYERALAQSAAQREGLRKDAERWRFFRKVTASQDEAAQGLMLEHVPENATEVDFDAAVDSAIAAGNGEGV